MLIMKTKVDPSQRKCTITFKTHISNTLKLHYQILSQEIQGPITKKYIATTKTCLNSQFLEKYSYRQSNLTSFPITQKKNWEKIAINFQKIFTKCL